MAQRGNHPTVNLLIEFADAAERLRRQLADVRDREAAFDAFLLGAALQQVVDDDLHRDVYSLGKAAGHLPNLLGGAAGRPAAAALRALRAAGIGLRGRTRSERLLIAWGRSNADLVRRLAAAVVDGGPAPELAADSVAEVGALPARVRTAVARLPHCFRSFDLRPEDLAGMVDSLSSRWPDRARPVLVVGLRTAGSYLAPLCAAFLTANGYREVDVLTLRPGQHWLAHEIAQLAGASRHHALVAVVDEPPRSGAQFALAARELEVLGVPRRALVLLVPLFGSAVPTTLSSYETVPLTWEQWDIHRRLAPEALASELSVLVPSWSIKRVERVRSSGLQGTPRRGHITAAFRVELLDERSGEAREEYVAAEGVGLGYLGRHAAAVAGRLRDYVPEVHGISDGLLYRKWLPEEWRATRTADAALPDRIAAYVVERHRALSVEEDLTRRMPGRDTAADLTAQMLSGAFGRAGVAMRPMLTRAARQLLATPEPSVVDGSMSLDHWFARPGRANAALKVDFHTRAFSNEERACFDPVYDLAGAAAGELGAHWEDALLRAYERLSGKAVAAERWLLYQLLYHHSVERPKARAAGDADRLRRAERAMARAHQRYFASQVFSSGTAADGPLCAIDVDWVLEVRWLGFPAMSPASAMALLALTRHGYRPVIATGRSLDEVKERCASYGLAGGVAEYGAVVYSHALGRTRSLLSAEDDDALKELRSVLRRLENVQVDPSFAHSVRAYRIDHGARAGLDRATIETALGRVARRARFSVVEAMSQTDFIPGGVDKGAGVRALAEELGERRIAFAAGDTAQDLPMLRLAERAGVPSNADRAMRSAKGAGVEVARRPYGAGLLELVSGLLGHRPGRCAQCAPPVARTRDGGLLLAILGGLDGGPRQKAQQAAVLAAQLAKLERA